MNTRVFHIKSSVIIAGFSILILLLIMANSIGQALNNAEFWPEVSAIAAYHWGKVTIIDLYIGLILFSGWVFWRENHFSRGLIWASLILLLGNLISCIYLLISIYECHDDLTTIMTKKEKSI